MKGHPEVIEALNRALTVELTAINQYFCQAKMCKNWGYHKLAAKQYAESIGEMKHAEKLIDRSLGFTPRDIVRDGLPNFGSMRDDWIGAPRPHKGIDIYGDKMGVQAVAGGKVVGVGYGERSGGWATIGHGNGVETLYVHISRSSVKTGDDVARGQSIAAIDGAVGNAVQPQLHFELRLDNQSVDPIPYISVLASEDLKRKITRANQRLEILEQERAARVRNIVEGRHD